MAEKIDPQTVLQTPATPTLKALMNELKSVSDWHTLGVNLDLKSHQLTEIEKNHRGDDQRCKTEMLACWQNNTTTPSWEAVAEALCLMDAHTVANRIRRKFITTEDLGLAQQSVGTVGTTLVSSYRNMTIDALLSERHVEDCDPGPSGSESDPEGGFICGCGKCDLATYLEKGCPSSLEDSEFPYLFPKKLRTSEFRLLKWKLVKASQKIVQKFASLERNTISMLKGKEVPLDEVKNYVLTLGVHVMHNESVYKDKPLLLQERAKIEAVKDFGSLFFILKGYYSWFSFSIIEALREDFLFHEGAGEDERLNKYKIEFHDYCRRRIYECPKSMFSNSHSEDFVPLSLKVDDDFNMYSLVRVMEFQSSISEILGLSKYTLQLCDVADGCITVVFRIPSWLATVITISSEQQQELKCFGVKWLKVAMHGLYEESLIQQKLDMNGEELQMKQNTSGTPSTSDQGENTTVVMEKETQEQPDALPKRMKADKTQSHTVLSNFHVALDKGTVHLQGIARREDVKGSKETALQRSNSMYCLETGSDSLLPFHIGKRKLSQSMDKFPQQSPKLWSQSPLQISKLSLNPKEMELLEASKCGQLEDVNYLLMTGVNVNVATVDGETALEQASMKGHQRVVESLLRAGANPNLQDKDGYSPLYCASQEGHDNIVEMLLQAGAKVDLWTETGGTSLYIACQEGHLSVVEHLIAAKAHINHRRKNGTTPLMVASYAGHPSVVRVLLQAGAHVNTTSRLGSTALHFAVDSEHEEVVELLLKANIDVDLPEKNSQQTALMIAAEKGSVGIVRKMIQLGASVNLTNKSRASIFLSLQ